MKLKFKNIKKALLPFLFSMLLVFPPIEKAFHDFGHAEDAHCSDNVSLHFHQTEHNCALCDYQSTPGLESPAAVLPAAQELAFVSFSVALVQNELSDFSFSLLARGPPAV